ncbi:MAG: TonB-dependent receptor [Blastocatellia bacterium]
MNKPIIFLFAILFLFLPFSPQAQTAATLRGQVNDLAGAGVAGAQVGLRNTAADIERQTTAGADGRFQFTDLAPGLWRLRVEHKGFSVATQIVTVETGQNTDVNVTLAPGSISEQVTVTAARGQREARDLTVPAEIITQEQILRENTAATQETLTKSAQVTPVGNGPFQQRPRLRGLDSTRILILVDGERLNTSRVATDRAGPELGLVDPSLIQNVEVVGGSGSVLYGTDALSGTINIITDQPRRSDTVRVGAGLNLLYGTNDNGRRGNASFDLSGRYFALRVAGALERYENYHAGRAFGETSRFLVTQFPALSDAAPPRVPPGTVAQLLLGRIFPDNFNAPFTRTTSEIPNSQAHGSNLDIVGRLFPDNNGVLRVGWIRRRAADVGFPDFSPPVFFQTVSLPFSNLDKYSLRYERSGITPWFTGFALKGYHQQQDRNLRNDFAVYSAAPPRPGQQQVDSIVEIKLLTDTRQNVKSYGWDAQGTFLLSSRNILTTGASWFYDHSRDSRVSRADAGIIAFATRPPAPPTLIPVPRIPFGPPATTFPQRVPKSDFKNLGFFAQDEWHINRWLRILGGVRVDRFDISTTATPGYDPLLPGIAQAAPAIDLSKLPNAAGQTIDRSNVSGDIGMVIQPTHALSFSGRVGRSFRHPNLEELFFTGPATIGNIIANTKVQPETGVNVDLGVRYRTARYSAAVNYFNNTYRNFISTEFIAQAPQPTGLIAQAINFARVRITGFETNWEVPQMVGSSALTYFWTLGYLRGTILEGANPFQRTSLRNAPADNISPLKNVIGLRWQGGGNRFWAEYNARTQAQVDRVSPLLRESPFLIAQDYFALPGFTVHTARGGYNFQREHGRVALTFGLENFGNKFYREQFQFAPARGRSLTIGLLLKVF